MAINKFKGLLARSRPSTPGSRTPRTPRTLQIPNVASYNQPTKPALPEFTWNQAYVPPEPEHKQPEPEPEPEPKREEQSTPPPTGRPRHKSVAEEAADIVEARKAWKASNVHPSSDQTRKGGEGGTDTPPGEKGHAHEPTDHSPRLLGIGLGGRDEFNHEETPADIVSDSPTGIDFNIYDTAFEAEIERIRAENRQRGPDPSAGPSGAARPPKKTTYLTRFVNEKEKYFGDDSMILEAGRSLPGLASSGMRQASAATARALGRMHLAGGGSGSRGGDDRAAAAAAAAAVAKSEEAKTKEEKDLGEGKTTEKGQGEGWKTPTPTTNTDGAGQKANANDDDVNKTAAAEEEPMTISESFGNVKESVHNFADVVARTMQNKLGGAKGGAGASKE